MNTFDYNAPAELFPSKRTGSRFAKVSYKRFDAAASAIRYAMEDLEPDRLAGAVLEVGEERYDDADIRSLYASDLYPFCRRRKV